MKIFIFLFCVFIFSLQSFAIASEPQSWLQFYESKEAILRNDLVFPRGFKVDKGTRFTVLELQELDGLDVYFMLLQADYCTDITHIEEMMIIKPELNFKMHDPSVGVTWDPLCQSEIYVEKIDFNGLSLFDSIK